MRRPLPWSPRSRNRRIEKTLVQNTTRYARSANISPLASSRPTITRKLSFGASRTLSTGHCGCYPRRTKATGTPTGLGLKLARVVLRTGLEGHWHPRWLRIRKARVVFCTGHEGHWLPHWLTYHCARCAGGLIRGTAKLVLRAAAKPDLRRAHCGDPAVVLVPIPLQIADRFPVNPKTTHRNVNGDTAAVHAPTQLVCYQHS